ncbi:putative protein C8orf37 [Blattamonas nauphoetae]|uniref:Cilia- and flagella-associated protein 418 n=1 Tax=Blattamonas nauphoetae TaxID=2049346 RepID=A0ABQ9Y1S7_9EUKA|nr:putative protein C8orf37 [Blattamonas nauphoetae]
MDIDKLIQELEEDSQRSSARNSHALKPTRRYSPKTVVAETKNPKVSGNPVSSDDIDDLDQFIASLDGAAQEKSNTSTHTRPSRTPGPIVHKKADAQRTSTVSPVYPTQRIKHSVSPINPHCQPTLIGGESIPFGWNLITDTEKRCNNLHCTHCDLNVVTFPNSCWKKDLSYITFRNANTNPTILKTHIIEKSGTCAYCCQCTWRSVKNTASVSSSLVSYEDMGGGYGSFNGMSEQLHWICLGHH